MELADLVGNLREDGLNGTDQRSLRIAYHTSYWYRQGLDWCQETFERFRFAVAHRLSENHSSTLNFSYEIDCGIALIGLNAIDGEKHASLLSHLLLPFFILGHLAGSSRASP